MSLSLLIPQYISVDFLKTIGFRPIVSFVNLLYSVRAFKRAITQVCTTKLIFSYIGPGRQIFVAVGGTFKNVAWVQKNFCELRVP